MHLWPEPATWKHFSKHCITFLRAYIPQVPTLKVLQQCITSLKCIYSRSPFEDPTLGSAVPSRFTSSPVDLSLLRSIIRFLPLPRKPVRFRLCHFLICRQRRATVAHCRKEALILLLLRFVMRVVVGLTTSLTRLAFGCNTDLSRRPDSFLQDSRVPFLQLIRPVAQKIVHGGLKLFRAAKPVA